MSILENFKNKRKCEQCCSDCAPVVLDKNAPQILIAGSPNVGKSVLFNALTGMYAAVSNYPGTSVEVSRGSCEIAGIKYEIIDTPGMYSLSNITEEERVTKSIILEQKADLLIHVVDAKNLERMLPLTFQLMETGMPLVLALNIMDEAKREGVVIDVDKLSARLGIPVVSAVFTQGTGVEEIKRLITTRPTAKSDGFLIKYSDNIEQAIKEITPLIDFNSPVSVRALSLLLLKEDKDLKEKFCDKQNFDKALEIVEKLKNRLLNPVIYEIAVGLSKIAGNVCSKVITLKEVKASTGEYLGRLTMNPWTGVPILLLVLYFGLYKFVGSFGAGTVVNFLEGTVFGKFINPWMTGLVTHYVPWRIVQDLLVSEYGVLTLGFRYALAIILPIVGFFFIVFSIIEDSGYLPRLAMLIDRLFKQIGLSGRAVIPMVLGFGCATMATMVTRTLPTKRERLISTMLLALAVPCSAQLGVILALLADKPKALFIWCIVIALVFLFIGYLTALILPGDKPSFYMELPPLRMPKLANVLTKTYVRMKWYLYEIIPLFLLASVLIWIGNITGLFGFFVKLLVKPVGIVGLPAETAKIFLYGFFRRDYGAAGLYDLSKAGMLTGVQLVVASVALTLFLPCIAQLLMNIKERGLKTGIYISIFVLFMAFSVAYVLNFVLLAFKVVI